MLPDESDLTLPQASDWLQVGIILHTCASVPSSHSAIKSAKTDFEISYVSRNVRRLWPGHAPRSNIEIESLSRRINATGPPVATA